MESSLRARIAALVAAEPTLADAVALRAALIEVLDRAELPAPALVVPADRVRAKLAGGMPLLDGEALVIPPAAAALFERLAVAMLTDPPARQPAETMLQAARSHRLHPEQVIGEAIAGHDDHLQALADAVGVPADLLGSLADLAARPLLAGLAARLRPALRLGAWQHGYCPVCAARPIFGERTGAEGEHAGAEHPGAEGEHGGAEPAGARLRCGRCATAWAWTLPRCPLCQPGRLLTRDTLTLPDTGVWSLDACDHCQAYLKVAATPRTARVADLLVDDLVTWRLDRLALDWRLWRPSDPGRRLELADLEGEELDDD